MSPPVFDWKRYYARWIPCYTGLYIGARFFIDPLLADGAPYILRAAIGFVIAFPLTRWIVRREHYTLPSSADCPPESEQR